MSRDTLTGSRIRERRTMSGLKQAELAERAGISPSYLNLIEHNRRRIGGKLLLKIASVLEVEPSVLTEGAEAALIAGLREAAADARSAQPETDRADEFAGRFPGWANLLAETRRRVDGLERSVELMADRLTHDPELAAALHEMLSTVTAIRSSASILAEPGEVAPEWQARFLRNINEDSSRLAETSRALVGFLDANEKDRSDTGVPQEEVDAILADAGHRFDQLETGGAEPDELAAELGEGASDMAVQMLTRVLRRYAADARALPEERLAGAIDPADPDPIAAAGRLGVDPAQLMRRLAALSETLLGEPAGLAICDASGALTYRRPLPDFPMPKAGSACPLWPLFAALTRPAIPLAYLVEQPGRTPRTFRAVAIAAPAGPVTLDRPPLFEGHMILLPLREAPSSPATVLPVGTSCRICPRPGCHGRREPSILGETGPEVF
ncbi:helix-turn-helix domain-containing protein [Litorisediminicola beolgyonensis]|uniref:Helix-turn-helix domain-containing protein n=1 Tax=Litorisediminicola beolgyonensis TaxID=1173614 RepID=A0ABW3ZII1_9RHOB